MSYRKITVDGVIYEYVIGERRTKIKNIGVFLNEDIGQMIPCGYCECCGESLSVLYPNADWTKLGVTPHDVMKTIKLSKTNRICASS